MVTPPSGFEFRELGNGDVAISHDGRPATTLRRRKAAEFVESVAGLSDDEAQDVMARLTGNHKRGNERTGAQHPRNRARRR